MATLFLILLIASFVCLLLSAFQVHTPKVNLLGLGLALWVLVPLLQTLRSL